MRYSRIERLTIDHTILSQHVVRQVFTLVNKCAVRYFQSQQKSKLNVFYRFTASDNLLKSPDVRAKTLQSELWVIFFLHGIVVTYACFHYYFQIYFNSTFAILEKFLRWLARRHVKAAVVPGEIVTTRWYDCNSFPKMTVTSQTITQTLIYAFVSSNADQFAHSAVSTLNLCCSVVTIFWYFLRAALVLRTVFFASETNTRWPETSTVTLVSRVSSTFAICSSEERTNSCDEQSKRNEGSLNYFWKTRLCLRLIAVALCPLWRFR